jgi:predicted DNA-binding transcriptional regulator AlpA
VIKVHSHLICRKLSQLGALGLILPRLYRYVEGSQTNYKGKAMNTNTTETPSTDVNALGIARRLRVKEVIANVSLSRATIYRQMGEFKFPLSVKVSVGLVGWRISDIRDYVDLGPDGWFEKYGRDQQAEKLARQA